MRPSILPILRLALTNFSCSFSVRGKLGFAGHLDPREALMRGRQERTPVFPFPVMAASLPACPVIREASNANDWVRAIPVAARNIPFGSPTYCGLDRPMSPGLPSRRASRSSTVMDRPWRSRPPTESGIPPGHQDAVGRRGVPIEKPYAEERVLRYGWVSRSKNGSEGERLPIHVFGSHSKSW